jgi:hypothetical protein
LAEELLWPSAAIRRDDVDGAGGYCAAYAGSSLKRFVGQFGDKDLRVGLVEIAGVVIHGNDPLFAGDPL